MMDIHLMMMMRNNHDNKALNNIIYHRKKKKKKRDFLYEAYTRTHTHARTHFIHHRHQEEQKG